MLLTLAAWLKKEAPVLGSAEQGAKVRQAGDGSSSPRLPGGIELPFLRLVRRWDLSSPTAHPTGTPEVRVRHLTPVALVGRYTDHQRIALNQPGPALLRKPIRIRCTA